MATCITYAGETLIAQKQANGQTLTIDKFILAQVPGLDPNVAVDRAEGKPDAGQIVHEYVIPDEYKGFVNPNQVVYSMLLGSDLGNFTFNWLGLYSSADDVVVAISHLPDLDKIKTDPAQNITGNNLTRNILLEFSGAQTVTNITVETKTWQIDFTARLNGIDERMRKACRDIYGRNCFIKDAALINNDAGNFSLQGGFGYVEGIRLDFSTMPVMPGVLPKKIWLDVALQQQGSDKVPVVQVVFAPPAEEKADYMDSTNDAHYLVAIADIDSGGVVTDLRRVEQVETDLVKYLLENGGKKEVTAHLNDTTPHGLALDGGETGQVLIKQEDGSIAWGTVAGVPVGELCFSTNGVALPGTVPVNVKQKVRCDLYPQLFEWMKGGTYLTDEAAWDAEASAQDGSCGKYCWDGGDYFILPCYQHHFAAATVNNPAGSWLPDEIKAHSHIMFTGGYITSDAYGGQAHDYDMRSDEEVRTQSTGGTETRPKTSYVLPCIKAFDVPINAAHVDMLALAQQVAAINGNKVDRSEWVELVPGEAWQLPNKLIIQCGQDLTATAAKTLNFPIAFPNACIGFQIGGNQAGSYQIHYFSDLAKESVVIGYKNASGSSGAPSSISDRRWTAIGF